jgi:adenylate kinase
MPPLVFIGGIHGSGKTTHSRKIAIQIGIQHLSAGELISTWRNRCSDHKIVSDVESNQEILVAAFRQHANGPCILGGHFCVLDDDGEVSDIPLEVFARL